MGYKENLREMQMRIAESAGPDKMDVVRETTYPSNTNETMFQQPKVPRTVKGCNNYSSTKDNGGGCSGSTYYYTDKGPGYNGYNRYNRYNGYNVYNGYKGRGGGHR